MSNNQVVYDVNKCFCKKNKFSLEQCSYKKKDNSNFCGIHSKTKNKDIFPIFVDLGLYHENDNDSQTQEPVQIIQPNLQNILNNELVVDIENNNNIYLNYQFSNKINESEFIDLKDNILIDLSISELLKKEDKKEELEDRKKIYDCKESFFEDLFIKNKDLSVFTLRQSIKILNLKILVSTKQSRPELIQELKQLYEKEKYLKNNLRYIIKIQKFIKEWSNNRLKNCVNDTDILTFDNISEIPKNYLYIFNDKKTNLKYAYDIRTMIQILNQDKPQCPYTCRDFDVEEKVKIMKVINNRKSDGINMNIEKIKLKPEEETEMRMIDVFHKLNLLGNYTSHLWLKNMSVYQLIKFYSDAEDLWVYRLGLTHKERKKYIKNGQAFIVPVYEVKNYNNLNRLRNVCLDEIDRFISDGIGSEEKKLGAMWMLTVLVDSSIEAAEALPHLVQI